MGTLNFLGEASANAWKSELEELNHQADTVMNDVAQQLKDIQTESVGSMVDALVKNATELTEAVALCVKTFANLAEKFGDWKKLIADFLRKSTQNVEDNRANMIR